MTKLSSSILDHVVFQTYYSSYFLKCPLRKPISKTDIVTKLHIMKTLNFEQSHQKEKKRCNHFSASKVTKTGNVTPHNRAKLGPRAKSLIPQ